MREVAQRRLEEVSLFFWLLFFAVTAILDCSSLFVQAKRAREMAKDVIEEGARLEDIA